MPQGEGFLQGKEEGPLILVPLSFALWFGWHLRDNTGEVIDLGGSQATFCPLRKSRTPEIADQSGILTKGLSESGFPRMTCRREGVDPGESRPSKQHNSISKQSRVCR